jgi:N-acyl-L-homoserine lactone synthetase
MELDQFDRPDARYLVAYDDHDAVIGTARLLPTTRPC